MEIDLRVFSDFFSNPQATMPPSLLEFILRGNVLRHGDLEAVLSTGVYRTSGVSIINQNS